MRVGWLVCLCLSLSPAVAQPTVHVGQNYTAVDRGDVLALFNGNFTRTPAPDVNGGVGPDHVVLFIKGVFKVYNKHTGQAVQTVDDVTFWNSSFTNNGLTYQTTQTRGPSDPRIFFHPPTNRWYAVGIDRTDTNNGVLNIGVTSGPDPSAPGAWRAFTVTPAAGAGWADFPTIGMNDNGLYVCSAIFGAGSGYRGSRISFIPTDSLTAASPNGAGELHEPITGFISNPAIATQPLGGPMPVVLPAGGGAGGSFLGGPEVISYTLRPTSVDLANPGLAPQPGATGVSVVGDRITSNLVYRNGEIWGVCQNGINIQWFRLNALTGGLIEKGSIESPDGLYLYFPSIAVNDLGDVVIGMNGSNTETFISAYAVAGKTENGVTTFGAMQLIKAGQDSYQIFDGSGRNRWGDYSTTVADPTNPFAFWTFQEFVAADRLDPQFGFIDNNRAIQITQIVVPEPAGWLLLSGLAGLTARRRR